MHFGTKINHKKFYIISIPITLVFCLFAKSTNELFVILGIYLATLVYLGIVSFTVFLLVESKLPGLYQKKRPGWMLWALTIGKFAVLLSSIILGVQIMGTRIIIPVLNYIIQIFVLGVSSKKPA